MVGRARLLAGCGLLLAACIVENAKPPPAQSELIGTAASWLMASEHVELPRVVYVLVQLPTEYAGFGGLDGEPAPDELAGAEPAAFGDRLDDETRAAVQSILEPQHEVRFAGTQEEATDRDAQDILGCYPYLDGAGLVSFGAPRTKAGTSNAFVVAAYASHACQGTNFLLQLTPDDDGYAVTVLSQSMWSV